MNERLKSLMQLVLVGIVVYFLYSWLTDDTCRLSGCDNKAIGWKYYEEHQPGVFGGCIGACRMGDSGGYCSKEHVYADR
jgi:hypothetical protein